MARELIYDTETSGYPSKPPKREYGDPAQPHLVQLALIYRVDRRITGQCCFYGTCPGLTEMPEGALAAHGITVEMANAEGMSIESLVAVFNFYLARADIRIGHNEEFDYEIMLCAAARASMSLNPPQDQLTYCTMKEGTAYNDGTWPKLSLLHEKILGTKPVVTHHAMADTETCLRCYDEMMRRNEGPT